jgi:subfamily B ATP-binding cassette protein MsbA
MRRIGRLLHYMRPYTAQVMVSVLLMAVVGAMAAFRVLLIKPTTC